MTEEPATPTVALERRPHEASAASLVLSDDEIRRTFRVAEALALSGMFKDSKKAEQAFAKIVMGRDLGLTAAQSMQGIHVVEGGVQMHYSTLGSFVRSRDGYDYRAGWLKLEEFAVVEGEPEPCPVINTEDEGVVTVRLHTGEVTSVLNAATYVEVVVVWHAEEEPTDLRPIIGAVVEFTVDGTRRGLSRYTEDDAKAAGLIKEDKRAAWHTSRRNMLLARAMSNGVKWFVPEVMGGMPVYTQGEIPERPSITAAVGDGGDEGTGVDLGPKVDEVIARATELGHAGLSNRGAIEVALGSRAPGVVNDWLKRARAELDKFAAQKAEAEGTVVDAEIVVEDEPAPEPAPDKPPVDLGDPVEGDNPMVTALRRRFATLQDMQGLTADDQQQLNEEMAHVEAQLRQATEEKS